jgi:hypothetical protein
LSDFALAKCFAPRSENPAEFVIGDLLLRKIKRATLYYLFRRPAYHAKCGSGQRAPDAYSFHSKIAQFRDS